MQERLTQRGFAIVEFSDLYDLKCSLQASSLADLDAIWLGVHVDRMHLTREHVRELLPYLQRFADTGDLFPTQTTEKGRS